MYRMLMLIPIAAFPLVLAACDSDPDAVVVSPPAAASPPGAVVVPEDRDDAVIIDRD